MKISKIFGFVLCLHLGVITVLIVQPGCRTSQPPTQSYQQQNNDSSGSAGMESTQRNRGDELISSTPGDSLDAAFNSGFETSSGSRYAPQRPADEFGEFGDIAAFEPITNVATVNVEGTSFDTYTVKQGDSLWAIAKRNNVSLNEIYSANALNKSSVLKLGQEIRIPVEGGTGVINTVKADTFQPSGYNMATENYTVRSGDTLSKIAKKYDTSIGAIKASNGKGTDMIRLGEELVIPVGESYTRSTPAATPIKANYVAPVASSVSASGTHLVKAGEYPATIARQYGMTSSELLAVNGITDPRTLQVGQKLKVSASGSAANVDSKTETVSAVVPAPLDRSTFVPAANNGPVEIRVIEADPLFEEESAEINTDSLFENAIEIPVIRMDVK
jgi:LysM repeat protein